MRPNYETDSMFRVLQKSWLRDWWKGDRSKLVKNFTNLIRLPEEFQSLNIFMSHMTSHQTIGKGALKSDRITCSMNVSVCAQLCPTLCNLMDCRPQGSSFHRIFQARVLEWVAIYYSRGSSHPGMESASPVCLALPDEFFINAPVGKHWSSHINKTIIFLSNLLSNDIFCNMIYATETAFLK